MATQEKTWNVANRLHSQKDSDNPEVNHIIAGADEIYDDTKGAKQSDINAQADAALADRYTKAETYSQQELNSLITTPDVSHVSVVATSGTTAVTDLLPAEGAADTIYRIGNWDGTQYDHTVYSLYAWNGTAYVCLAVRSFVGEVYDISVNHPDGQGNPTPYADLAAALGSDGENIPADIRRGGMSIKFIQSSDNTYVQYRLMADTFSTTESDWQGVDDAINKAAFSGFFVGKGENASDFTSCVKAVKGHIYAIYPVLSSWDFGTTTYNKVVFGVSCRDSNKQEIRLKSVIYQNRDMLSGKLQVTIPDTIEANGSLLVYGRAAAGTKVWFEIVDITDLLAESDRAMTAEQTLAAVNKREDLFLFGDNVEEITGYVSHTNGPHKVSNANSHYYLFPVKAGDKITVNASSYYWCIFASRTVNNETYTYATGYSADVRIKPDEVVVPADGAWFYIAKDYNNASYGVTDILLNGIDVLGDGVIGDVKMLTERLIAEENRSKSVDASFKEDIDYYNEYLKGDIGARYGGYIRSASNTYISNANYYMYLVPIKAGDVVNMTAPNSIYWFVINEVTFNSTTGLPASVTYATGYSSQQKGNANNVVVPDDGHYLYLQGSVTDGVDVLPTAFTLNGIKLLDGGIIAQAADMAKIGNIESKVNSLEVEINGEEWKNKEYIGYYNGERWVGIYEQYKFKVIPINPGDTIDFRSNSDRTNVLSDFNGVGGTIALSTQTAGAEWNHIGNFVGTAGSDAKYFMFYTLFSGSERLPTNIFINGIDVYEDTHLKANVEDLSARVATIEGDGSIVALNGGETHMKLIMDNLVRKQGTPSSFTGNRPFVLLYFSDIHGKLDGTTEIKDELAISRIVAFKEKYSSYLSDTLHGGDGVYTSMAGESTLDYDGAESILNTIGNHDVLISGSNFADAQAAYDKFFAGKIENWGTEYTEGLCYYYKDYAVSKLRLIILDCMHWDSAQNTWLAATLADAAENGISVVICDHYVPHARFTILREECTFSTLDPDNIASGGSLNAQASATVQATIDDATHPLDFVCWLFGHTHRDYFGYLTDYPNQYGICIAKASGDYSGWEQDSVRTKGTKAYDCLNLISVDTTAKVLSIIRLGNNTDRFMRQKNYLAFDYANHKIMGNS